MSSLACFDPYFLPDGCISSEWIDAFEIGSLVRLTCFIYSFAGCFGWVVKSWYASGKVDFTPPPVRGNLLLTGLSVLGLVSASWTSSDHDYFTPDFHKEWYAFQLFTFVAYLGALPPIYWLLAVTLERAVSRKNFHGSKKGLAPWKKAALWYGVTLLVALVAGVLAAESTVRRLGLYVGSAWLLLSLFACVGASLRSISSVTKYVEATIVSSDTRSGEKLSIIQKRLKQKLSTGKAHAFTQMLLAASLILMLAVEEPSPVMFAVINFLVFLIGSYLMASFTLVFVLQGESTSEIPQVRHTRTLTPFNVSRITPTASLVSPRSDDSENQGSFLTPELRAEKLAASSSGKSVPNMKPGPVGMATLEEKVVLAAAPGEDEGGVMSERGFSDADVSAAPTTVSHHRSRSNHARSRSMGDKWVRSLEREIQEEKQQLATGREVAKFWKHNWRTYVTFHETINHAETRIIGFLMCMQVIAVIALDLAGVPFFMAYIVLYGFTARFLCGPRFDPSAQLTLFVLSPLLIGVFNLLPNKYSTTVRPKRFAQFVGVVFSVAGILCHAFLDDKFISYYIFIMLFIAMFLMATLDICLGCVTFYVLIKVGIFEPEACKDCVAPSMILAKPALASNNKTSDNGVHSVLITSETASALHHARPQRRSFQQSPGATMLSGNSNATTLLSGNPTTLLSGNQTDVAHPSDPGFPGQLETPTTAAGGASPV